MEDLPAIAGGSPVRTQYFIFGSPSIGEKEILEVAETIRSGWVGTGPKVKRFEELFRHCDTTPLSPLFEDKARKRSHHDPPYFCCNSQQHCPRWWSSGICRCPIGDDEYRSSRG